MLARSLNKMKKVTAAVPPLHACRGFVQRQHFGSTSFLREPNTTMTVERLWPVFFGKDHSLFCSDDKNVQRLQQYSADLVHSFNPNAWDFVRISRELVTHVLFDEHLPRSAGERCLNTLNNAVLFDQALRKMFYASHGLVHGVHHNSSGIAAHSARTMDMSLLLRMTAFVGGILLPNMQTVCVNPRKLSVHQCAPVDWVSAGLHRVNVDPDATPYMSDVLATARANGTVIGLFVDDLPAMYKEEHRDHWAQLHGFVANPTPKFTFVSGASSVLPFIVRGSNHAAIRELTNVQVPFDKLVGNLELEYLN